MRLVHGHVPTGGRHHSLRTSHSILGSETHFQCPEDSRHLSPYLSVESEVLPLWERFTIRTLPTYLVRKALDTDKTPFLRSLNDTFIFTFLVHFEHFKFFGFI